MEQVNTTTDQDTPTEDVAAGHSMWRRPGFGWWFVGDSCQIAARSLCLVVFPLLAIAVAGSAGVAGMIVAAGAIGTSVALLPGGMLADRRDRRRVILVLALVAAAANAVLIVDATRSLMWAVAGLILVIGLVQGLMAPAFSATLKGLVEPAEFPRASSLAEGRSATLSLVVPALGGVLFGLAQWSPFLALALLTVIAAVVYLRIPAFATRTTPDDRDTGRHALWAGISFVAAQRTLLALVTIATLINLSASAVMVATIFHLRELGTAPSLVGALGSCLAVGSLMGAVIASVLVQRVRSGRLILGCLIWIGAWFGVVAFVADSVWLVMAAMTAAIIAAPSLNAVFGGYLVASVPKYLQGRVDGAVTFGASLTAPLAPLMAGWGMSAFGYHGALAACLATVLAAALPAVCSRRVRAIGRPADWQNVE